MVADSPEEGAVGARVIVIDFDVLEEAGQPGLVVQPVDCCHKDWVGKEVPKQTAMIPAIFHLLTFYFGLDRYIE